MTVSASGVMVKVCGLRQLEHALGAACAGADFIGMVFAESPRRVTVEQGQTIVAALEKTFSWERRPLIVGVFANHTKDEVIAIAQACRLDYVQLSGDEPWNFAQGLPWPVIKVVKVGPDAHLDCLLKEIEQGQRKLPPGSHLLLDAQVAGQAGGTGQIIDWALATAIAARFAVILAGGLKPDNVTQAIDVVRPWGVDASSGLETNGQKDPAKIAAFVAVAKSAALSLSKEITK